MIIYNKQIVIIIGIIIVIGILIWGAITGLTNIGDLINGVSVESNDNIYGGKTIKKSGDKASFVKTFPKEEVPVVENGIVTGYTLVTDKEEKVVSVDLDIKCNNGFEEIATYYRNIYSEYSNYIEEDSDTKESYVKLPRKITITSTKNEYKYTITIKTPIAGSDRTEIKLVMENIEVL